MVLEHFQNRYALTEEGAKDLLRTIGLCILLDATIFLPLVLAFKFLADYINLLIDPTAEQPVGMLFYIIMSLILFAIMYGVAYIQYHAVYIKVYEESARRRIGLAETLRKIPLAYFGKKDVADLSSTIMGDVTEIETGFSHAVPQLYAAILLVPITAVFMFVLDWRLSLALFWVVPVAALIFYLSKNHQEKGRQQLFDKTREISDKVQESLDLVYEIKSYNKEQATLDTITAELDNYENLLIKSELFTGASINFAHMVLKLGLPTVILVGAYLLSNSTIDIFMYLVFLIMAARIYDPIMQVLMYLGALLHLDTRIKRINEIDNMPLQEGKTEFQPDNYDIAYNNVNFSYQEGVRVLQDVSFTAKQGEVTALVGPSGGGKSTTAKLSARFWDIDNGSITLGGEDISTVDPETLLQNYAIVFQDVLLFNSSVMENIRLGRKDATDEEVIRAAQLARCDEFVSMLPQGYDTQIGENGEKLSGGERQRISIARAILKDAPIILLDEATASLDAENETKIQSALSELIKDKTVLIIAHRMRTVLGADKIVVIKDGQVAETGHPMALDVKNGVFSSMLKAQFQSS